MGAAILWQGFGSRDTFCYFYMAYTLWNADFVQRLVMVKLKTIFFYFHLLFFKEVFNCLLYKSNYTQSKDSDKYLTQSIFLSFHYPDNQSNSLTPRSSRFCKFQSLITHARASVPFIHASQWIFSALYINDEIQGGWPSLVKCEKISVFLDYLIAWHIDNHVITPQVAPPSLMLKAI